MIRGILIALLLSGATVAHAKPKKPRTSGEARKKEEEKPPRPDDKGTNEGGRGRQNATEDAAKGADSPSYERRP